MKIISRKYYGRAYNMLNDLDKENIIEAFFKQENIGRHFDEIALDLDVSSRAFSRVLKEANINTRVKGRYEVLNQDYFEVIDTERKAYFLGLIYADGYVGIHDELVISFKDNEDGIRILNILKEEVGFTGELKTQIQNGGYKPKATCAKLNFSNAKINSDLRKLGLSEYKLKSRKHIPDIPKELIPHFIRGLFDGDGSITVYYDSSSGKPCEKATFAVYGNDSLLQEIRDIFINELGCNYTSIRTTGNSDKIPEYRVGGKKQLQKVKHYLYDNATIYFQYKRDKFYSFSPVR